MNKATVYWSSLSSIRVIPILLFIMLLVTSCDFPGFGQKPACGQSVLKIGDITYEIKETKTKSDGSLKISQKTPDIAYWVNQTATNYVFALSPTAENLALQTMNPEQAVLTWENCNSSTYVLTAPQAGIPDMNTLLDQSFSGITIFVQKDGSGFVIRGELSGEEIQSFDTPDPSAIQAEISLLETIPAADTTTIKVNVSITNNGQTITLTSNDVSLLIHDSIAIPLNSEPALPKEIASGATETLSFTFAYPNEPGAILRVFDVEYELEGY